jgi:VanZ family protein
MARQGYSSAVPLALVFAGLIVYASLYPFIGWRLPGAGLAEVLKLPMPPWRVRFDIWSNLLGYLPMGALLYGAGVRSGGRSGPMALLAVALPALLSYGMEVTQQFLPGRYPSLLDWWLNTAGAALGVVLAWLLQALSLVDRWEQARERWFVPRSGGALALMALWPVGLLFPTALPLGLGPGWERLQDGMAGLLLDVPWAQSWLDAIYQISVPQQHLPALLEGLGLVLGLLCPCLLAFSVTRPGWRRAVMALGAALMGLGSTTLSAALNFGPVHALAWLTPLVPKSMAVAAILALLMLWISARLAAALGVVALVALLLLVLQAPVDPYFAESLQAWEQGRFIRFHGLAQWVGLLWPFAALFWLLGQIAARPR